MKRMKRFFALLLTVSLIMNAFSMATFADGGATSKYVCEFEEHIHTEPGEECWALDCKHICVTTGSNACDHYDCGLEVHSHDAECRHNHDNCVFTGSNACVYTGSNADAPVCGKEEHTHAIECLGEHDHKAECYELDCDIEVHVHTFMCTSVEKSKTATALDDNDVSKVTLTVGGIEENLSSDIVFILGGTVAANESFVNTMIEAFKPVLEDEGSTLKIGVVVFADKPNDIAIDLNSEEAILTSENVEEKVAEIMIKAQQPEAATNMEGALIKARDMLNKDTSVSADRKYMFLISTGLTHFFTDENGYDATIAVKDSNGGYIWGNRVWQKYRVNWTHNATTQGSSYPLHPAYKDNWGDYWQDIEKWVAEDGNKYVYSIGDQTYADWYAKNKDSNTAKTGTKIKVPAATSGIPHFTLGANPRTTPAAAHALNYERSQYEAWTVFNEMKTPIGESFTTVLPDKPVVEGLGYNCFAVGSMGVNWRNGSSNLVDAPNWAHDTETQIGHSFMNFLEGKEIPMYSSALGADSFANLKNSILNSLSRNSRVEDYIGYNDGTNGKDPYNFDFIDNMENFTLKVGTTTYDEEKVDNLNSEVSSTYEFTKPGESAPTFKLEYYAGDLKKEEHFIWTINENVSVSAPAILEYDVKLVEKSDVPGTHKAYTNQYANLYPLDSDGKEGSPQEFPKPEVEYKVPPKETEAPTTEAPTTEAPTTEAPTTEAPTTEAPTTEAPTTEAPTTEAPTTEPEPENNEPETTQQPTTTVPETTVAVITETTAPTASETLPYVDPDAQPEDIPQEVLDAYYERYRDGSIDLEDIPFGVLGAFFEKGLIPTGLLPATGDPGFIWSILSIISAIGLAFTVLLDRKRRNN